MAYKYLFLCLSLFFVIVASVLFLTRARWRPFVPEVRLLGTGYIYSRLPSSFVGGMEAGLSSNNFNLDTNIAAGDNCAGLDDTTKAEILKLMKKRQMTFDQARKLLMENRFKAHGISPDGRPRDPKLFSFS